MIRFFLLQNKSGKTRLSKYYHPFADDEKIKMENEIHRIFMQRDTTFTNFVEVCVATQEKNLPHLPRISTSFVIGVQYKSFKLVFRRYAGLFFIFAIDVTDNELLYLESIHLFVEVCLFGYTCLSLLRIIIIIIGIVITQCSIDLSMY